MILILEEIPLVGNKVELGEVLLLVVVFFLCVCGGAGAGSLLQIVCVCVHACVCPSSQPAAALPKAWVVRAGERLCGQ